MIFLKKKCIHLFQSDNKFRVCFLQGLSSDSLSCVCNPYVCCDGGHLSRVAPLVDFQVTLTLNMLHSLTEAHSCMPKSYYD